MGENAKLRVRLEIEMTEEELRKLFAKNRVYLEGIWNGSNDSARHKAFHQSRRTRHALTYMMITDPFTDDQLDWTLEEIGKVWMRTKRENLTTKSTCGKCSYRNASLSSIWTGS